MPLTVPMGCWSVLVGAGDAEALSKVLWLMRKTCTHMNSEGENGNSNLLTRGILDLVTSRVASIYN